MERADEAAFVEEVRRIALAVLPRTMDRAPGCQAVIGERGMRTQRTEEKAAKLGVKSIVDIVVQDGRLVVTPVNSSANRLTELLAQVTDENLHEEFDTGPVIGREAW